MRLNVFCPKCDVSTNPTGVISLADVINDASINYIRQCAGDLFEVRCRKFTLFGSIAILTVLRELSLGVFDYDFYDKVIFDIGGFQGETAVLFFFMGAR